MTERELARSAARRLAIIRHAHRHPVHRTTGGVVGKNVYLALLGVKHIYIRAGPHTSNGCVERVHQTLLEECWKPAFACCLTPKYTGL